MRCVLHMSSSASARASGRLISFGRELAPYSTAFVLSRADTYPTRQWRLIANLQTAADVSSELFDLKSECAALSSCWVKYGLVCLPQAVTTVAAAASVDV